MKRVVRFSLVILACAACVIGAFFYERSHPVQTRKQIPAPTLAGSLNGVSEYHLANGLKVLLFPDESSSSVTVNITYLVGSRSEGYGETGMAHLLEHMLFKGSTHHEHIDDEISAHAAQSNASTWLDRTNYFETMTATPENLSWALSLESDRMVNSFVAQKDLDSEMTVVRNEMEGGENSPESKLQEEVVNVAYDWHNYGKSTIGARSDVEHVPIPRLQAFYHTYYQPDNAVLVVAGKIDVQKTLDEITATFGAIPKPTRVLNQEYTVEPAQEGPRTVELRRAGGEPLVIIGYHIPPGAHADTQALMIAADVLTRTPGGVLTKAFVDTYKAVSLYGSPLSTKYPGYMLFAIRPAPGIDPMKLRDEVIQVLEGVRTQEVTDDMVERAKATQQKWYDDIYDSLENFALMLTEYVALGDWRLLFVTRDQLHTVTTDDVRRVMHTYFVSNNRTTGVYIPGQQSTQVSLVPMTQQEIDAMVSTAQPEQTTQGAFFDPSIENIAKVQQLSDIGTAKVSFIPRQTRGDTVSVAIDLSWGTERSLFGKEMVGSFAGIMLEKMAGALNEQEIQDKLLKLRAQVTLGGGASGARITIDAHKDTLPEVIALVGTIVKRPGVPTALLERERATFIAGLHDEQHDTQAIAGRLLARHINTFPKGDVRAATTVEEDIAAASHVTAADIAAFWKRFYSAQHAFIAVVGSFDQVATTTALTDAFGSWGSSEPYIRLTAGPLVTTTVNETVVVPDKADAFILGYEPLQIRDDDAAYPALTLANFMFGGGFMNSRVMTRIRQKDGLSYGAGTSLTADSFEQYGSFTFNATAAPQNIPKVEAAFKEELASVISKGFTDDEVTLAKQGMLETLKQDRMDAPTLAQQYVGLLYVGRTIAFEKTYEDAIERLTTAEVNEAVKKYWTVDGMSFFKAGTFKEEAGN